MEELSKIGIDIVLYSSLLISIYSDYKYHKIYNKIIFPGMILALILNVGAYHIEGLISSLLSGLISLVFFGLFYLINMIGAGDVKLIVLASMLTNPFYALGAMIVGSIIAAIYAMFIFFKTKSLKATIPYGIFIGVGFIVYKFLTIIL